MHFASLNFLQKLVQQFTPGWPTWMQTVSSQVSLEPMGKGGEKAENSAQQYFVNLELGNRWWKTGSTWV